MTNAILSIPSKTIRAIQEELSLPLYIKRPVPDTRGCVIRWGSTRQAGSSRELNKREAIMKASNKKLCRQLLFARGIPVPQATETDFPLVGRKTKHTSGSGFFYCRNRSDVENAKRHGATYFSKYYPKTDEYRVHVGSGKTLLVSVKEGDKTKKIWNKHKNGFTFRHLHRHEWLDDDVLHDMVRIAKRAVETIGLSFGAVDMLVNRDLTPQIVVCEINTSPSLSNLGVKKYVAYFRKELLI